MCRFSFRSTLLIALLLLLVLPIQPARANGCDFGAAERVVIADYTTFESMTHTSPAIITAPSSWAGETFWEGYTSATPFGAFLDEPMRALATFWRGNVPVGMAELRGNEQRAYVLLMDEDGKVSGSNVWHACAALIADDAMLAWFDVQTGEG